jgi:phosphate transport system permease protein
VDSTHYRVLFLAGLVLFLFTFAVNTVAELVRQRLRRKYSSL